jgi:hypothetical protein
MMDREWMKKDVEILDVRGDIGVGPTKILDKNKQTYYDAILLGLCNIGLEYREQYRVIR